MSASDSDIILASDWLVIRRSMASLFVAVASSMCGVVGVGVSRVEPVSEWGPGRGMYSG